MKSKWVVLMLFIAILVLLSAITWGRNSCVNCHQRSETIKLLPAWYQDSFIHWYGSVHGREGVTCEKCHGGEPSHATKKASHKGMKSSSDPASPIYYKNVPKTCGACHVAVYQQFIQSRHYRNLAADRLAPSCTTCHGFQMDTEGVDPLVIVGRCTLCHKPQGVKPEVENLARQAVEQIADAKHAIRIAQLAAEISREQGLKPKRAEELIGTAQERLKNTGALWHNFNLSAFREELREIRATATEAYALTKGAMRKK